MINLKTLDDRTVKSTPPSQDEIFNLQPGEAERLEDGEKPPIDPATLLQWIEFDKTEQRAQKKRMVRDQMIYAGDDKELSFSYSQLDPNDASVQNMQRVALQMPRRFIDKGVALITGSQMRLDVPPRSPNYKPAAQRMKNGLSDYWFEWADQWLMGYNSMLLSSEASFALLRGTLARRLRFKNDDPRYPIVQELADPLFLYPRYGPNKMLRVSHIQKLQAQLAHASYPDMASSLPDDPTEEVEIIVCYMDGWRYVYLDNEFKYSRNDGYDPWIITPAGGPAYRTGAVMDGMNDGTDDEGMPTWTSQLGTSAFEANVQNYRALSDAVSMLMYELRRQVDPSGITYGIAQTPKPAALRLGPGDRNYLTVGENADIQGSELSVGQWSHLVQLFMDEIEKNDFSRTTYGIGGDSDGGYHSQVLNQTTRDVLSPSLACIKSNRMLTNRKILMMREGMGDTFEDWHRKDMEEAVLLASDITENGYRTVVDFRHITPSDKIAMARAGMELMGQGALSMESFLGPDWMDVEDPPDEKKRVFSDLAMRGIIGQPGFMEAAAHRIAYSHPEMAEILEEIVQGMQQNPEMMSMAGGGQGGPPKEVGTTGRANPSQEQGKIPPSAGEVGADKAQQAQRGMARQQPGV